MSAPLSVIYAHLNSTVCAEMDCNFQRSCATLRLPRHHPNNQEEQMTSGQLRRRISQLTARPMHTTKLERVLAKRHSPDTSTERYSSQREHWLRWLSCHSGRSAKSIYNSLCCPPMVLWLGEACGVDKKKVSAALLSSLIAKRAFAAQCAAIRRVIPWQVIESRLSL